MDRAALIVLFVAYFAVTTTAFFSFPGKGRPQQPSKPHNLRCWKCENKNLYTCKTEGEIEKCQAGVRQSCQTEIRYTGNGRTPIIKTGCKQGVACSSNKQQNRGAAWAPTQCNTRRKNSVCRCCCVGSMCNRGNKNLLCQFPATPIRLRDSGIAPGGLLSEKKDCGAKPEAPGNGTRQCFGDTGLRSFCKFQCNRGYKLDGKSTSICTKIGNEYAWNRPTPICIKEEICMSLPRTPDNGFKFCRGKGEIGSQCSFVCDHGYRRFGPISVTCELTESGAKWSFPPPTCKIVTCEPLPEVPENGDYECDGIGELGTKCDFTCDAGYDLIGHENTVCLKHGTKGVWSNTTPICKEVRCMYLPKAPTNGHRECSGDGELGTVCEYACHFGYRLKGFPSTACHRSEQRGKAKWNRRVPTCEPVCMTMPDAPEYGSLECEGEGEIGTHCRFECVPKYELTGSETTTCEMSQQGPIWTQETPVCDPVCELLEAPVYGHKMCYGEGKIGTFCIYGCDNGFRLEGISESVCKAVENGADWNAPVPTCIPACNALPALENGDTSCEGNGDVGTNCSFECRHGHRLNGVSDVTCVFNFEKADWSHKMPTCEDYCGPTPEKIQNGNVVCRGTGEAGTTCNFSCEGEAYELIGEGAISCAVVNGQAKWSKSVPKCDLRPTCPPIGQLEHGKIACNSDLNVDGTTCEFECLKQGFSLVPKTRHEVVCYRNETWSKKPCCIDCTKVKRDIMIAMDSSGSISLDGWKGMVEFVQNIIRRFSYGDDATLFSIFQFSTGYRSDGNMFFNRYPKKPLIRQVPKMKKMGSGTMTGQGLRYAQRRFGDRGNRKDVPDMLFILTDGEAEDPEEMLKAGAELRKQGVEILALAIAPTDDFVEQMTKLTGDSDRVIVAESIAKLTEDVVEILFSKTCQDERECKQY